MGGMLDSDTWKDNIMYRVEINKQQKTDTSLYVEFSQTDGRLVASKDNVFPYKSTQAQFQICWLKMDPGQQILEAPYADNYKGDNTFIRGSREDVLDLNIPNGNYLIVPMPYRKDIETDIQMSFYFNCKKDEIKITDAKSGDKGKYIKRTTLCSENTENLVIKEDLRKYLRTILVNEDLSNS